MQSGTLRKGATIRMEKLPVVDQYMTGDKIASSHSRKKYEITEVGILNPEELPTSHLQPGQVGFISCNMKESSEGG